MFKTVAKNIIYKKWLNRYFQLSLYISNLVTMADIVEIEMFSFLRGAQTCGFKLVQDVVTDNTVSSSVRYRTVALVFYTEYFVY